MSFEIEKNDDEWREELSSDRYAVLRRAATEAPFSGSLLAVDAEGVFSCGGCHQVLFTSAQKFDSGCGWPSFDACEPGTITERADRSLLRQRTEISARDAGGIWVTSSTTDPRPVGFATA